MPTSDPEGVCIALTDAALEENPAWTRLDDPSGYDVATSWTITRGRSSEFDKTGTGIASIAFKDSTGLLDPTNTTSDFYNTMGTATYLDPMRQIAIALQHPISMTWNTLFRGFLSSQDHEMDMWSDVRGIDNVTWEAADGFDLLGALILTPGQSGTTPSLADFADVYYQGTPANLDGEADVFVHVDDRIVKLLDDAGWPGTGNAFDVLRDIFSGNCSLQGKVYNRDGDETLSALFDAADAEFCGVANVYMSRLGKVTFRGRLARFNPTNPGYGINTWLCGGMPEALADNTIAPISGLTFRRTKDDIINSVIVSPQNADDADIPSLLTQDAPSIASFGLRSLSFPDIQVSAGHTNATPTTGAEEAKKQAEYIVGNYKDPKTRVSSITFRPRAVDDPTAGALWDLMVGVEIGDRVQLTTQHVGGGGFSGEYFFVEGIRYEASGMNAAFPNITLELEVSPQSYYDYNPFGTVDGTP